MLSRLFVGLFALLLASAGQANAPRTFSEAKKVGWKLYTRQSVEFYCGCRYSGNRVGLTSCGYKPRKNANHTRRIEWERIVPAQVIGYQRRCWQSGERSNCARHDSTYQRIEADLRSLVPSTDEINGDRSNFGFGWLPQKPQQYDACPMMTDFKARKAVPRPQVRGVIARTYFYISNRYGPRLSKQDRQLYNAQHKQYPPQTWERQYSHMVDCVIGWGNPYVGPVDLATYSNPSSRRRWPPPEQPMIFRTLTLLPLCAALTFVAGAGERRFDCTVVAIHDGASLGYRLPGVNKALRIQLDAVELPATEPRRRHAQEALEDMLLGKSATVREQGCDARFRILGAAWMTPADYSTCGHTLDAGLALLTIGLTSWHDAPDGGQTTEARGQCRFAEEETRARRAGQWGLRDVAFTDGSPRA